jgi:hypothetical protein
MIVKIAICNKKRWFEAISIKLLQTIILIKILKIPPLYNAGILLFDKVNFSRFKIVPLQKKFKKITDGP